MMVRSKFREISHPSEPGTKKGRYHGSNFWDIEGFAKDKWVIGAYVEFDADICGEATLTFGKSQEEIVEGCVEYLNQPPERKKYEKKNLVPPYGTLSLYQYTFKKDHVGRDYIEVLLITDQKKNKNFWGKGTSDKF